MALNMADLFEHAADAFPGRVALIYGDRRVSYRELEDEANRLAHHLAAQGAGPGDHVGLYARNSVEAVATLLALRDRLAPPTLGFAEREEGMDLDYVPDTARPLRIPTDRPALALSNSFGFGGHNSVLCLEAA